MQTGLSHPRKTDPRVRVDKAATLCDHNRMRRKSNPALHLLHLRHQSALFAMMALAACGGGQWGYAPEYQTYGDEDTHLEGATEVTYEEVRRDPADFRASTVAWFGIVEAMGDGQLRLSYRTLSARNLCQNETAKSCRVTVSERAGGPFVAKVDIAAEHAQGRDRVWEGTLVRVIGKPTGELDPDTGGPVIAASYYRHWPHGKYVTTGARGSMRR